MDGAGLMLADERGDLRWAAASDQQTRDFIEEGKEGLGRTCVNAFAEHAPMAMRDATKEPQWGKITDVVTSQDMRAGLSVPVQLEGGPIGTLDLYSAAPEDRTRPRSAPPRCMPRWRRPCSAGPLPPR